MGRCIIKLGTKYVEWSTISDAPVTYGMTREQLEEYVRGEYGESGMRDMAARMDRVERCGSSMIGHDLDAMISCNRAGSEETELSLLELISLYDGGAMDLANVSNETAP